MKQVQVIQTQMALIQLSLPEGPSVDFFQRSGTPDGSAGSLASDQCPNKRVDCTGSCTFPSAGIHPGGMAGHIMAKNVKPYWARLYKLSVEEGCFLWGLRVVIMLTVQRQMLQELHQLIPV